jgi:hypothetical protein
LKRDYQSELREYYEEQDVEGGKSENISENVFCRLEKAVSRKLKGGFAEI